MREPLQLAHVLRGRLDLAQLDRFLKRVEQFRVPIIGGIWPEC